jgi:ABC-type molybdate transport system substrate-binding protein
MGIGALAAAATVGAAVLMGQANAAKAAEIAVFATTSLRQALEKLGPQFERASGHKLNTQLGTSAPLKRQIDAGAPFDLAILVPAALDALIKEGKVQPETRVDVARSAIGVAVKAGAPKPETDTAEALRRTLLAAKSISYSGEGASGKYFEGLLERLGIAAEVTPKLRPLPSGEAGGAGGQGRGGDGGDHARQHHRGAGRGDRRPAAAGHAALHRLHRRRGHDLKQCGGRQGADCAADGPGYDARHRGGGDGAGRAVAGMRGRRVG